MSIRELRRTPAFYGVADVLFRAHDDSENEKNYRGVVVTQSVDKVVVVSDFDASAETAYVPEYLVQPE